MFLSFLVLNCTGKHYFLSPVQPPPLLLTIITMSNPLLFQPLLLFGTQEYIFEIELWFWLFIGSKLKNSVL